MERKTNLQKFYDKFFSDEPIDLLPSEQAQLIRYRAAFTLQLEKPYIRDEELRDFLMTEYGISKTQAYRDISNVKILLGNVKNAGKEWIRYVVIDSLKTALSLARDANDPKEITNAASALAKYSRLDKEDEQEMPWDEIIPQNFEPTSDPTVIGLKPIPNLREKIMAMKRKYETEIEIEEIDYQPLPDDNTSEPHSEEADLL